MRLIAPIAAAALIAVAASALPAAAQGIPCGHRQQILTHLASEYSENPVAMGLDAHGRVLEVLASKDSRTWTILITLPNGITCLIESGTAFEQLANIAEGPLA